MSVIYKTCGKTAIITLDRPEKSNAFDEHLIANLNKLIQEASADKNTQSILITGNGKHFSAGADLNWMRQMAGFNFDENQKDAFALAGLLESIHQSPKVTAAIVNGGALGGGAGLVAACDFAFSHENAFFAFSEIKLGLVPAVISPYVLETIGPKATRKLFLTGRRFLAEEALKLGFIDDIYRDAPQEQALNFLEQFNDFNIETISTCKKLINNIHHHPINTSLIEQTAHTIASIRQSEPAKKRISAFLNKD